MTPQSTFLYAAPLMPERKGELRALLKSMNAGEGIVDPANAIFPFAEFPQLHFARLLIVEENTRADRAVFGLRVDGLPKYLILMGEIDGEEPSFRAELVHRAGPGVRQLFSHCIGYAEGGDLNGFLKKCSVRSAANYVNWRGRTVLQVLEEERLRRGLEKFLSEHFKELRLLKAGEVRARLQQHVAEEQRAGSLRLTPAQATPWRWRLRNFLNLVGVPLLLLMSSPLLVLALPVYLWRLRQWEQRDPEVNPPVDPAHVAALAAMEDHETTNQFSVFGSLKPGLLRALVDAFVLADHRLQRSSPVLSRRVGAGVHHSLCTVGAV